MALIMSYKFQCLWSTGRRGRETCIYGLSNICRSSPRSQTCEMISLTSVTTLQQRHNNTVSKRNAHVKEPVLVPSTKSTAAVIKTQHCMYKSEETAPPADEVVDQNSALDQILASGVWTDWQTSHQDRC